MTEISNFTIRENNNTILMTIDRCEWVFDKSEFEYQKLDIFQRCAGCTTMPTNGFQSNKNNWCSVSRRVASLQEIKWQEIQLMDSCEDDLSEDSVADSL